MVWLALLQYLDCGHLFNLKFYESDKDRPKRSTSRLQPSQCPPKSLVSAGELRASEEVRPNQMWCASSPFGRYWVSGFSGFRVHSSRLLLLV
jgi:hypothetical protein